jgi:hypothetical protein
LQKERICHEVTSYFLWLLTFLPGVSPPENSQIEVFFSLGFQVCFDMSNCLHPACLDWAFPKKNFVWENS